MSNTGACVLSHTIYTSTFLVTFHLAEAPSLPMQTSFIRTLLGFEMGVWRYQSSNPKGKSRSLDRGIVEDV